MTAERHLKARQRARWVRAQVVGHLQLDTNRQRITMMHVGIEVQWALMKWWHRRKGQRPYN